MKLHLPKLLLTAVLAACVAPAMGEFTGPTTDYASGGTISSATTATEDTAYTVTDDSIDVTATGYNIKFSGDDETALGTVTADSLWIVAGRYTADAANDLNGVESVYVSGSAALQFTNTVTYTSDFSLGTSTYVGSGWNDTNAASIRNSAFIFGAHNATGKTVTFSGDTDIQETAHFGFQYGGNAVFNGALTGSGSLGLNHQTGATSTLTLSGTTSGYTGAITVGNNVTLKFGAVTSATGFGGTITTAAGSGVVVNPALGNGTAGQRIHDVVKAMNSKVDTADGTFITLTVGSEDDHRELRLGGSNNTGNNADITLNQNFKFTNLLIVHGGGDSKQLLVNSGATLQFDAGVHVVSKSSLKITGGSLITTGMTLGHSTTDNSSHWGKLEMTSGSIKTGTITFRNQSSSAVQITGGMLEFSSATAIAKTGSPATTSVRIMGEDATDAMRVILKAVSTDWTLDGSYVDTATVGNVTVDEDNAHGISFANVTLSGSIVNNKKLTLLDGVSFASDAATVFSGAGTTYLSETITTDSSLTIGGTLALGNDISVYESNGGSVSYVLDASQTDVTNDSQNGFQCLSGGDFWLVKGADSNLADGVTSITAVDGSTTYTLEDVDGGILINGGSTPSVNTTKYYVSNGSVDVVGTDGSGTPTGAESYVVQGGTMNLTDGTIRSSEIDYTSGAINLASTSSTLVLDSSTEEHNNSLLTLATGSGNIEIDATTTLAHGAATQISGDIIINSGKELILGRKQNPSIASGETFGTVANIVLNGGQLTIGCDTTTLSKVSTKEGSGVGKLYIWDMYGPSGSDDASGVLTINELVVNSGMQIQSEWKSNLNIAALSGSGELQLQQRAVGNNQVVTINAGQGYTGHLNLDGGDHMTVNLNIAKGATTKIKTDNSSTINKLTLAEGATLRYNTKKWVDNAQFEYTLKEVVVSGINTAIKLEAESDYWQGCVNIDSLTNAKGEDDAIIPGSITLSGNAKTSNRDVMNLNGGDFEGTITYKGASGGSNRKHALNITSTDAAAKAVIKLEADSGNIVALGIASSEVKVRGIEGTTGTIYSGEQSHMKDNGQGQQVWNSDAFAADGTTRKLTINTAGDNHATSAAIVGNLNISKSGEGKQTFSGDISQWSGNITVTAGELVFNNAVSVAEVSVTGGTLTVGTYDGTGALTTEQSLTATNQATFGAGAVVNANLVLSSGATVTMAEALTMGSTLTLSEGMTLDGTMLTSVTGLREGETVDLFKSVDSLMLGNATYDADNALAEGTVSLNQYFTNVTNESIYLAFNNGNVFAGVMSVPEPTTATLSLLALAGLAARRRRASR